MEVTTPSSTSALPPLSSTTISTPESSSSKLTSRIQLSSPTALESISPRVPQWLRQTLRDSYLSDIDIYQHSATSSTPLTRAHKS